MNPVMIQAFLRLLSAVGVNFDPVMLAQWIGMAQQQIPAFIVHVQQQVAGFDARLTRLEQLTESNARMLEALCAERGIDARGTGTAIARSN